MMAYILGGVGGDHASRIPQLDMDVVNVLIGDYEKQQAELLYEDDPLLKLTYNAANWLIGGNKYKEIPETPFELPLLEHWKKVNPIWYIAGRLFINDAVRDVIEAIEPGVHQYIPVRLVSPDPTQEYDTKWLVNVCSKLDTISRDPKRTNLRDARNKSSINLYSDELKREYIALANKSSIEDLEFHVEEAFGKDFLYVTYPTLWGGNPQLPKEMGGVYYSVLKEKIQGHAIWCEYKAPDLNTLVSDAFIQALADIGITKYLPFGTYVEEI